MDWKDIAERAQRLADEGRAHRERLADIDARAAEREHRIRITRAATVAKPEPPPPEPTKEERKADAMKALSAFVTHRRVVEDQPVEQPRADDGTFAALSDRAKAAIARRVEAKARDDEKAAAAKTFMTWLGNQGRGE